MQVTAFEREDTSKDWWSSTKQKNKKNPEPANAAAPFHFINLSLIWSLQEKKRRSHSMKTSCITGSNHEMFYRSHSLGYPGLCSQKNVACLIHPTFLISQLEQFPLMTAAQTRCYDVSKSYVGKSSWINASALINKLPPQTRNYHSLHTNITPNMHTSGFDTKKSKQHALWHFVTSWVLVPMTYWTPPIFDFLEGFSI